MSNDKENIEQEKKNKPSWWKKLLGLNPSYKLILIYNIITFIGINNFSNICYAQENNVNNIKLTPYIECPKKGLCKLYQRENDVIQTTIKKISQYEYIFLGEVVHYYVNGYASSKMVDTNEIKKYNIIDNKFYLIKKNDPNDGYIVVDLNNNKLLLDYLKQICLYDIKTNKIDTIYNSKLRYGILIPYDDNNFIFTLENGLYKFDLATKSYSM